jgi:hypothetical protein
VFLPQPLGALSIFIPGLTAVDTNRVYFFSKLFKKPFRDFLPPLEPKSSEEDKKMVNDISYGLERLLKEKGELILHLKSKVEFLRK